MTGFSLPFPFVPGADPVDSREFQQRVQQNFEQLALAVGPSSGRPLLGLAAAMNVRLYAARLSCTAAGESIIVGLGVTGIARTAAGSFTLTHETAVNPAAYIIAGAATPQGNTGAKVTANFEGVDATTSKIRVYDAAGALVDGEVVYFIGIG